MKDWKGDVMADANRLSFKPPVRVDAMCMNFIIPGDLNVRAEVRKKAHTSGLDIERFSFLTHI